MKSIPGKVVDPLAIIARHYTPGTSLFETLVHHSRRVAQKAVRIAETMSASQPVDIAFVYEAAMLHDIGIVKTDATHLACAGSAPYVCHGYLGAKMLTELGLPRHSRVCETHVGTGISKREIRERNLPFPARDMLPGSIEERIICYADKFYSKNNPRRQQCKTVDLIISGLQIFGREQVDRFLCWHAVFGEKR